MIDDNAFMAALMAPTAAPAAPTPPVAPQPQQFVQQPQQQPQQFVQQPQQFVQQPQPQQPQQMPVAPQGVDYGLFQPLQQPQAPQAPQQFVQQPQQQFVQQPQALPQTSAAGSDALVAAINAMQQSNAQSTQTMTAVLERLSAPTPAAPPPVPEFSVASLVSPEEATAMQGLMPVLARVVQGSNAYIMQHHVAPLQAQLAATQTELNEARRETSASLARQSTAALHAAVPTLPAIINTPEWQAHLRTQVPLAGESVANVLRRAHNEGRFDVIAEHVASVTARRQQQPNVFGQPAQVQQPQQQFVHQPQQQFVQQPQQQQFVQQPQFQQVQQPPTIPVAPGVASQAQAMPAAPGQPVGVSQAAIDRLQSDVLAGRVAPDAYNRNLDQLMNAVVGGASLVN